MAKEKVLIIVESPSKIKTIQKYLPKDKEYSVLASVGHIADLSSRFKYNLGINVEKDFQPHFVINKDKINVLNAIIDSATVVDKILLCTDPDREGEAIAWHILQRIQTEKKKIKRIEFEEITKKGVEFGLKNERDLNIGLVDSAIARRVLDRIVGYMASPFVIKRIGKGTSAGRVQSVALKLVVDRDKEIQDFVKEEYWTIKANLTKFATNPFVALLQHKDKIIDKASADLIKEELEKSSFKVKKVDAKPKPRRPYPPLNTAKLQMAASIKTKINPKRSMAAAQALYQDGRITYIRTDSVRLAPEAVTMARDWIKSNHPNALPSSPVFYKNANAAQNAHEAIRPTNVNNLPEKNPSNDIEKIYKLIWESFVACQMKPAIYDTTSVTIETSEKRLLKANGRVLKELGWLVLSSSHEDDDDKTEGKLPILIEKDLLTLTKEGITSEQKFTQPPPRYKTHSLIEELEAKGVGRPSTYATIMNTICETRNFVNISKTGLEATDIGKKVVELLDKKFSFMEIGYTADLENKLDLIESGKHTYLETMEEFYKAFKKELDSAYTKTTLETDYICEKCESVMILKRSAIGYFLGCSKYPQCKMILPCEVIGDKITLSSKELKTAPDDVQCPICKGAMVVRSGKFGEFYSCSNYPDCKGNKKKPFGKKCPKCSKELFRTVFTKPPFQGPVLCCTGYPSCKYVEKLIENNFEANQKIILNNIKENTISIKKCNL